MAGSPWSYIAADGSAQNRRIFWDRDIYERELEQVFARCWALVGHVSLIPKPGDYITGYIGEDNVIVARQGDGGIKAFINACTHRGNKVCHALSGNTRSFVCAYHGWAFGTDGSLQGVPMEKAIYDKGCFDKSKRGLTEVAQVDTYRGLIFATFDPSAPPLIDYLGDMAWYLDVYFGASDEGTIAFGPPSRARIKSNWKVPSDNFAGDSYHVGWAHASMITLAVQQAGGERIGPAASVNAEANGIQVTTAMGHGCGFMTDGADGFAVMLKNRELAMRYLQENRARLVERLGEFRGKQLYGSQLHATIFPNFSLLSPAFSTLKLWHPRGPHEIEVWSYPLVDAGWPQELQDAVAHNTMISFQPTGVFEADDTENFEYSTLTNRGFVTRQQNNDSSMGSSRERSKRYADLPGYVTEGMIGETPQRGFYRFWSKLMEGRSWDEIIEGGRSNG
jgi:phenylpropionate dioxygenase-like ring-hydroxylating dioxygenase large terminal subunit